MARDITNFTNTTQLSTSASDVVSAISTGTKGQIRKLSFYNSGSSRRLVTVYVIASAGTAGTTNILASKAIPGGKTWNCIEIQGEVLEAGMKVQAVQDAGTDINANCSGAIIS